jgi:hypothetical protein
LKFRFGFLTALRENLDKTWAIVLTLPIGKARTNLELIHQSSSQLVLNMKKTLMEMVSSTARASSQKPGDPTTNWFHWSLHSMETASVVPRRNLVKFVMVLHFCPRNLPP